MPTGKGFTPLIGLAVVVALAMAAVFGAMSLTNPAFAAVGAPADAELAEQTFSPQQTLDTIEVYEGETLDDMDIIPYLGGREDDVTSIDITGVDTATATVGGILTRTAVALRVTGVAPNTTSGLVTVNLGAEADDPDVLLVISIEVKAATAASVVKDSSIPLQLVEASSDGAEATVDVSDYFMDGRGNGGAGSNGKITMYTAKSYPKNILGRIAVPATGMLTLKAYPAAAAGASTVVTVTAVDDHGDANPTHMFTVVLVAAGTLGQPGTVVTGAATFSPQSMKPGSNTRYDIMFMSGPVALNTLTDELVIELEDFTVASNIGVNSVAITVADSATRAADSTASPPVLALDEDRTTIAEDVSVNGEKIFITIGDLLKDRTGSTEDADFVISPKSTISVVLRQSAGVRNPSEAGDYGPVITIRDASDSGKKVVDLDFDGDDDGLKFYVPRIVSLSEEDGGLGDVVEATGKGFKNGTSLTFFVDKYMGEPDPANPTADRAKGQDGILNSGEDEVCVVPNVGSNDVGSCEFTITSPTFVGGDNFINAVDGRGGYAQNSADHMDDDQKFELKASMQSTPSGGSPGEIMLIQLVNFGDRSAINRIELSREPICDNSISNMSCGYTTDSQGTSDFKITIPNWAQGGKQELRVHANDGDIKASTTVDISGPVIRVTPTGVVANQRISLIGTGFVAGSRVCCGEKGVSDVTDPLISIGGEVIEDTRINGGQHVRVDNGGNWSASVDLPLTEATTSDGDRSIRITDSQGRTGTVVVNIPAREVIITPNTGRVGTLAVVRGKNFPSKNDEGDSFNVEIVYDAVDGRTTVSANPDAGGQFEQQIRIPTTADIPSTNTVKVSYVDSNGVTVVTAVTHEVPEGIITLSETSGGPGSPITINGEGFKAFVPIASVSIGSLDVTPAPKPSTDGNGMLSFPITIPGLDVGIQTIEVDVGRTVASVGFTVTESGINPGDIKEVTVGLEALGDNFVSVWHFNNDTKMWSFYTPALEEGNSLTHLITGETYLIRIKSTVEVILNNDTRNLTCVGDNCWNQFVW